jgi:hypothetical protein
MTPLPKEAMDAILSVINQIKSENDCTCLVSDFEIQEIAVRAFPQVHIGDPADVGLAKRHLIATEFLSESDFI